MKFYVFVFLVSLILQKLEEIQSNGNASVNNPDDPSTLDGKRSKISSPD